MYCVLLNIILKEFQAVSEIVLDITMQKLVDYVCFDLHNVFSNCSYDNDKRTILTERSFIPTKTLNLPENVIIDIQN